MAEEGLNEVRMIGRLVADADLKYTQGGYPVANFRIAIGKRVKRDGEWGDSTEFVPIVFWGKRAEGLNEYLTKGSRVHVSGEFRTRTWEKNGEKRYTSEVHINDIILLGTGGQGGGSRTSAGGRVQHGDNTFDDDSIPF